MKLYTKVNNGEKIRKWWMSKFKCQTHRKSKIKDLHGAHKYEKINLSFPPWNMHFFDWNPPNLFFFFILSIDMSLFINLHHSSLDWAPASITTELCWQPQFEFLANVNFLSCRMEWTKQLIRTKVQGRNRSDRKLQGRTKNWPNKRIVDNNTRRFSLLANSGRGQEGKAAKGENGRTCPSLFLFLASKEDDRRRRRGVRDHQRRLL